MNKIINISLLAIFFAGYSFANPFFYNPRHDIRRDLQEKYAQGLLTEYMLVEEGLSFAEVLDRDIQIMQDYKKYLKLRIMGNKGIFVRNILPLIKAITASMAAITSAGTGIVAISGTNWAKEKWEGKDNPTMRASDWLVNTILLPLGLISNSEIVKYNQAKFDEINKNYPEFMNIIKIVPIAGAIFFISGLLFIKMTISWYRHESKYDAYLAKWQKKIKDSNAIIGQLKKFKYNMSH